VKVRNSRLAPIRTRNWRLWIDLDGVVHQAKGPLYIPDRAVFYERDLIPGLVEDVAPRTEYPTVRLDEVSLHQAVQPGEPLTGWLWFTLGGLSTGDVRDYAAFMIEAVDENGHSHVIRRDSGMEWPVTVGVLDYTYPGDAYTLRFMAGKKPPEFL
jgi:hypothetical protein